MSTVPNSAMRRAKVRRQRQRSRRYRALAKLVTVAVYPVLVILGAAVKAIERLGHRLPP